MLEVFRSPGARQTTAALGIETRGAHIFSGKPLTTLSGLQLARLEEFLSVHDNVPHNSMSVPDLASAMSLAAPGAVPCGSPQDLRGLRTDTACGNVN